MSLLRLRCRADDDFNIVDAVGCESLVGELGVLGLVLQTSYLAVWTNGMSPDKGREAGIDANLEDCLKARLVNLANI